MSLQPVLFNFGSPESLCENDEYLTKQIITYIGNTSGVFKGFYKNKETGIGQFGGSNQDALLRIKGDLPFPIFSDFNCEVMVYNDDSNNVIKTAPEVDLAYVDPPYNQHPYGSNYFMLNLILVSLFTGEIAWRIKGKW
jgi:adenine-specific DNA methylase